MNLAVQYHNKIKKVFSPDTPDEVAEALARSIVVENEKGEKTTLWDAMDGSISLVRHCQHENVNGDACIDCGVDFS